MGSSRRSRSAGSGRTRAPGAVLRGTGRLLSPPAREGGPSGGGELPVGLWRADGELRQPQLLLLVFFRPEEGEAEEDPALPSRSSRAGGTGGSGRARRARRPCRLANGDDELQGVRFQVAGIRRPRG